VTKFVFTIYLCKKKIGLIDIISAPYTYILNASTQIAANIKVRVIDVIMVIMTILYCSSKDIRQQSVIQLHDLYYCPSRNDERDHVYMYIFIYVCFHYKPFKLLFL